MATFDPVKASEREVMEDISYFEGYDLPDTPPETPPTKTVTTRERTLMHVSLEKMFPNSPPTTPPRLGLKRSYSTFGPLSPPSTPPTRYSGLGLARTLSEEGIEHQISIFSLKSRPTIVTIDMINSPSVSRRGTLSRSSSYSAYSATSAGSTGSKDPVDRIRNYSAISTDGVFVSQTSLGAPVYSPPPNTPATFEPIHQIHDYSTLPNFDGELYSKDITQRGNGPKENIDPSNPFSFTGPTQYLNHSSQAPVQPSNGVQDFESQPKHEFPGNGTSFQSSGSSAIDLEKARGLRQQNHPQKKRHCARKVLICFIVTLILLSLIALAVVLVVLRIRHHYKHNKRMACVDVPGMYVDREWDNAYKKCT